MFLFVVGKKYHQEVVLQAFLSFLFSWIGDLLMMFSGRLMFFVARIASFLIAQVCDAFLFLRTINISGKKAFLRKKPFWLISYITFGIVVYSILCPRLDILLRIAVFVYSVSILSMPLMAVNRYGNGHHLCFSLVAGLLLFVISDC